jgi:dCTP deaminase
MDAQQAPPIEDWIPGVLSKQQMRLLIEKGFLLDAHGKVDHSAFDLHLTNDAYELPSGSVKPFAGDANYLQELKHQKLAVHHPSQNGDEFLLKSKHTYVFRLRERLNFGKAPAPFFGQATAKSSVGRVDVLARLITEGSADYETFTFQEAAGGSGDMYVEITPITFNVLVRAGDSLNQLRLFVGAPGDVEIRNSALYTAVLKNTTANDGSLSVDLHPVEIGMLHTSAFVARVAEQNSNPIRLWKSGDKPTPWSYWRFKEADDQVRFRVDAGNFYILRSRERIALPGGIAVYCRASDETIGEMRIHYAGFVHPLFGRRHADGVGTPLIFEVRGHDVHVSLRDGEKMARLIFYRMSQDAVPDEEDKATEAVDNDATAEETDDDRLYERQNLQLSKFFGKWPNKLTYANEETGEVKPALEK